MQSLYQPNSSRLAVSYLPENGECVSENPPRFSWMPAYLSRVEYKLQISTTPGFSEHLVRQFDGIPYNMFTPDVVLKPGHYFWRYTVCDDKHEWSKTREFIITEDLPEIPLKAPSERYHQINLDHPRLWLNPDGVKSFRQALQANPDHCGWQIFYERSVLPWKEHDIIPEPPYYKDGVRTADEWRKMYIDCQETLYAVRHLSIAGVILEDESLLKAAKEWLLHIAHWDTNGTTSRDYNDEAAFRIAAALAWGYDWLYNYLTEDELKHIQDVLLTRLTEVVNHVMQRCKLHITPLDSHGVRALSSVIVPCSIVLLGDKPKVNAWLDYTLEYFSSLYSPWGDDDGGWAEGPLYWTTGMAVIVDALNQIKNYLDIDFFKRPFFQRTGDFPLYTFSPDTVRMSFGDSSNLGDRPLLKTAYLMRQFAAVTGNHYYQWYFEQVTQYDTDPDDKYYNWGWWDFRFDNLVFQSAYSAPKAVPPSEAPSMKWFKGVGWVAIHTALDNPDDHVMFLTKSSPYGSVSHSHGDQNAFLLHAFGESFAVETGYYVAYNSSFHRDWRRQTHSKNAILIDGQGQYAGANKVLGIEAAGTIEAVEEHKDYFYIRSDATRAYQHNIDYVTRVVRETYFVKNSYFVIVDAVDLDKAGSIEWLLHSVNDIQIANQQFSVSAPSADLDVHFVYNASGSMMLSCTDEFKGVNPDEYVDLPRHYHLTAQAPTAIRHRLITLLHPHKKADKKYVLHFVNDQGFGTYAYFMYEGHTLSIEIPRHG